MRTTGRVLVAGIAMLAVGIVSGCGERSQVAGITRSIKRQIIKLSF